jgi:hypothetical protein
MAELELEPEPITAAAAPTPQIQPEATVEPEEESETILAWFLTVTAHLAIVIGQFVAWGALALWNNALKHILYASMSHIWRQVVAIPTGLQQVGGFGDFRQWIPTPPPPEVKRRVFKKCIELILWLMVLFSVLSLSFLVLLSLWMSQ